MQNLFTNTIVHITSTSDAILYTYEIKLFFLILVNNHRCAGRAGGGGGDHPYHLNMKETKLERDDSSKLNYYTFYLLIIHAI